MSSLFFLLEDRQGSELFMARAMVKCLVCEERFDWKSEDYVKRGRRYIHKKCEPELLRQEKKENNAEKQKELENKYRMELIDYTMELQDAERPHGMVLKQMKEFHEMGYSYQGMRSTLYYFHEILENPVVGTGIGIVPHVYDEAIDWYTKRLGSERSYNKLKEEGVELVTHKTIEVPVRKRRDEKLGKKFNIEELK